MAAESEKKDAPQVEQHFCYGLLKMDARERSAGSVWIIGEEIPSTATLTQFRLASPARSANDEEVFSSGDSGSCLTCRRSLAYAAHELGCNRHFFFSF